MKTFLIFFTNFFTIEELLELVCIIRLGIKKVRQKQSFEKYTKIMSDEDSLTSARRLHH